MGKTILITGAAGFIGAHLSLKIIAEREFDNIIGSDNMNNYYDVVLKEYRLRKIEECARKNSDVNWKFIRGDISDKNFITKVFKENKPDFVVNLAAQVGVRHSIINPDIYMKSNVEGFLNILEACRNSYNHHKSVNHLVYASSSSVYGNDIKIPFSVTDRLDNPISVYAVTKKTNELLASCYSHMYGIPATGLRFFTVYGPAGRPDMAYFKFINKFLDGKEIQIFNYGKNVRDFTYIDDVVEGIRRVIHKSPALKVEKLHTIYNIGTGQSVNILEFLKILQQELICAKILPHNYDFEGHKKFLPAQTGDVTFTCADVSDFEKDFDFRPKTSLRDGLKSFVEWYKKFYNL